MATDKQLRKFRTLRFSLGSAFVTIVVITSLLIGITTFVNVRKFVRNDTRERLRTAAAIAVLQIDPALHALVKTPKDEPLPAYIRLKKTLQQIRDRIPEVRYVYTFRAQPNGDIVFIVDAESNPTEMSHPGDVYKETTPTLTAAFRKPYRVHVERQFATDQWGTWLSSFAPVVRPDGSLEAVLGMDISAAKVIAYERRYLLLIGAVSLLASILVMVVGLYAARRISRPLMELAHDMNQIQKLDLTGRQHPASSIEEVVAMQSALENMKMGLRSFRRYVPAELVAELIALQKEAVLGATKCELTVFFSDIADFTTHSESLPSDVLATHLGTYFEAMTAAVLEQRGTVDKFIGDAIMAFWGAPRPMADHAATACRAALNCQRALEAVFADAAKQGRPVFQTRIGLNTGEVVVGNFGFSERLSYTALGDHVNLASRLEGLNKVYGTKILISEYTRQHVASAFSTRLIDNVIVKGKTTGIKVYELVAEAGTLDPRHERRLSDFDAAMQLYLDRRWTEALRVFEQQSLEVPTDQPAQIMRDRCTMYATKPPPEDWTGVIYLRDK